MLYFISALSKLVEPGITLTRNEVIKRYRAMAGCKKGLLQILCMTQFTLLGKDEKGELYFS
jgi:hypothetical protein